MKSKGMTLPTAGRPAIIGKWINGGRKVSPVIDDLQTFVSVWKGWWVSLQPESRVQKGNKLGQVIDAGEKWEKLCKGGINGFFNIVVSLAWWRAAITSPAQQKVLTEMVHDVSWVQDQIIGCL